VTGERSPSVTARARKLGIEAHLGIEPKASFLLTLLGERGLTPGEVAYLGDDVNDLGAMALVREAGLVGAPADALASVRRVAHLVTQARGGDGAYREFVEWLLELRTREPHGREP
jgi:YrbI family 3-deoxy-D-manno-octulosonate 8-phosphate phosphatase